MYCVYRSHVYANQRPLPHICPRATRDLTRQRSVDARLLSTNSSFKEPRHVIPLRNGFAFPGESVTFSKVAQNLAESEDVAIYASETFVEMARAAACYLPKEAKMNGTLLFAK